MRDELRDELDGLRDELNRAKDYQDQDTDHAAFCVVPNRVVSEIIKRFEALDAGGAFAGIDPSVSEETAKAALAAVREQFGVKEGDGWGPTLKQDWDFLETGPTRWAIVWEEGPFEWAYRAFHGGLDEELSNDAGVAIHTPSAQRPAGVFTEPITSWALGLYPTD